MTLEEFVAAHLDADLPRLLLDARKYPGIDVPYAVTQIEGLRKVKHKVPAWWDARLRFPPSLSLEQSSSEATAKFKAALFTGNTLADLTGGLGIDTYFWSFAFDTVHYVEQSEALCACARHNFEVLGRPQVQVHHQEAGAFVAEGTNRFDLVYLDPARRDTQKNRVFQLSDCSPDIVALKSAIFERTDRILVKTAPMLDIALAIRQLEQVSKVWVVAANNECKEVLYLLEKDQYRAPDTVPVVCVDTAYSHVAPFIVEKQMEDAAVCSYAAPLRYLYEPNAAILKAGAFKSFGAQYGLSKLDQHTHLYTSDTLVTHGLARVFEVQQVVKYDTKAVHAALDTPKANIAARNFPDTPEQMRKKLKLQDGGETYLFGATVAALGKVLVVCKKINP